MCTYVHSHAFRKFSPKLNLDHIKKNIQDGFLTN